MSAICFFGFTLFFIVLVVLNDTFMSVFFNSFVITLVSVSKYVKVAHFDFCVDCEIWWWS
jgi:hypothetical protein